MKRILVMLLLSNFLFTTTEVHEFLKLPTLLIHYAKHKQAKPDETFWHYLSEHYPIQKKQANDDNHHDHEKLPFSSHKGSLLLTQHISPALPNQDLCNFIVPVLNNQTFHLFYYNTVVLSNYHGDIFQPPKLS